MVMERRESMQARCWNTRLEKRKTRDSLREKGRHPPKSWPRSCVGDLCVVSFSSPAVSGFSLPRYVRWSYRTCLSPITFSSVTAKFVIQTASVFPRDGQVARDPVKYKCFCSSYVSLFLYSNMKVLFSSEPSNAENPEISEFRVPWKKTPGNSEFVVKNKLLKTPSNFAQK